MGCRDRRDWATVFELNDVQIADQHVTLCCRDGIAGLELILELALDADTDVLTRRTLLNNIGTDDYRLDWCASGAFAVPARCLELLNFEGQWSQEFQERRLTLGVGKLES